LTETKIFLLEKSLKMQGGKKNYCLTLGDVDKTLCKLNDDDHKEIERFEHENELTRIIACKLEEEYMKLQEESFRYPEGDNRKKVLMREMIYTIKYKQNLKKGISKNNTKIKKLELKIKNRTNDLLSI